MKDSRGVLFEFADGKRVQDGRGKTRRCNAENKINKLVLAPKLSFCFSPTGSFVSDESFLLQCQARGPIVGGRGGGGEKKCGSAQGTIGMWRRQCEATHGAEYKLVFSSLPAFLWGEY